VSDLRRVDRVGRIPDSMVSRRWAEVNTSHREICGEFVRLRG